MSFKGYHPSRNPGIRVLGFQTLGFAPAGGSNPGPLYQAFCANNGMKPLSYTVHPGMRGLPRPLRPEFGLVSGFTGASGPVELADGSLVMTWPIKFADSPEHTPPNPPPGPPPKHRWKTGSSSKLRTNRGPEGVSSLQKP